MDDGVTVATPSELHRHGRPGFSGPDFLLYGEEAYWGLN
jgi:hypothetical protein